ncbi:MULTISPECIES: AraC family transcriptional regulator [Raoultella]|uniref:AraC family transcriptional regulator n=1 Tax=Raoultella TaxID=160674 RepID=UPI000A2E1743|nr:MULTISPECIES: AraC family transcriptional regulator [Raoultella]MCC2036415.1 AraC family transcriptional regulator [Raoultella ornithinolytica]MCC2039804.1 AraC family transcriptional regulator [Raoultella ornithinolytica]MCC2045690.1 AraC family transcriptional regulator [Raoultella ornithinolytica]MCC2051243.1 AraC family transcriptional regulator [Raoultella ornithinolytica]MCC2058086.1 AraC family transcriptional regulator [Raoultella ornithinolytica]
MALMMGQRGLTFSVNRSAGNTVRLRSLSVHNIVGADAADRLSALWPGKAYITQLRSQTMPDNHPDSQHRRWQQEMASRRGEIREKIRAYTGRRENILCPFPGMSVVELHRPMPPCACLYQPSVSLIIQGEKRVSLGEKTYAYNESHFLLTAVNLPTVAEVMQASAEQPFISLLLQLDLSLAREVMIDMKQYGNEAEYSDEGMSLGPADGPLLDALLRYLNANEHPQDKGYMGNLIQREILYRILTSPAGRTLRETVLTGSSGQRISVALDWLRDNYAQPLKVEALARIAGMGVSTLHHHFRRMTNMSPLQYQKQLRLLEARRLLLSQDADASTAAISVGYESVSQFHREYKRQFGITPIGDKALSLAAGTGRPY